MSPGLALLLGIAAAVALAVAGARRPRAGPQRAQDESEDAALVRELAYLREELDTGELGPEGYVNARERLAARLALRAGARPVQERRRASWPWAVAGVAAATLVAVTLVAALAQRGATGTPTGNDQSDARAASSGVAEWRAAETAFVRGDFRGAVRRYRMAIAFLPERGDLRARFGFALLRGGRPAEALVQLRMAVRTAPRLGDARLYLGAALMRSGRRRAARVQWRRYLELEPGGSAADVVRQTLRRTAAARDLR